jgi:hypothetical protein
MSMDNAINHLAEEIEGMEHINPWVRAIRWIGGIVLVAGFVGWGVWTLVSPPSASSFSSRTMSYVPSGVASIDVSEPLGSTLDGAPVRFAWESVRGRLQYIVRVYVKGAASPVFERATTATSFELLPDERAKFATSTKYVWTVVAQGKDGAPIGAGQSGFRIR